VQVTASVVIRPLAWDHSLFSKVNL